MRRLPGLALAALVASMLIALTAGQASGQGIQCDGGDIIVTQDTTLDSDLPCSVGILGVDDVTLNLNGHRVKGVGIFDADRTVVENGTIFGDTSAGDSGEIVIRDNVIFPTTAGITIRKGGAHVVTGNRIQGGEFGILFENLREPATISSNQIAGTIVEAVGTDGGRPLISGNNIHDNLGDGIVFGRVGTVTDNRVVRNGGDGIRYHSLNMPTITGNTVDQNGDDGIDILGIPELLPLFTVNGNHAWRNGDLGIEAPLGIGGSGNWAKHNGNPAQCIPGELCSTTGKPKK